MKKKLCLVLVVLIGIFSMIGCSRSKETSNSKEEAKSYTVTFYDSDAETVLKSCTVNENEKVESFTPSKEGSEFTGWYGTKDLKHDFDFTKAIVRDTNVYAGFLVQEVDTKQYAIVGSGLSPVLLTSNWGKQISEEHLLTKTDDAKNNVYTITLDLYEGDQFQIAADTNWNFQKGFGYLKTADQDGVTYFSVDSGLSDGNTLKSNIKCSVTGNYTITLTTYPGSDTYDTSDPNYSEDKKDQFVKNAYDNITFTYNGETKEKPAETETVYYIKGANITLWADRYDDQYALKKDESGNYEMTIGLKEKEEFLFTSQVISGAVGTTGTEYLRYSNLTEDAKQFLDGTDSQNMIAKKTGTYTFKYNADNKALSVEFAEGEIVEAYDYYVKGSFGDTNWETECNPDYQLVNTKENPYMYQSKPIELTEGSELGIESMKVGATADDIEASRVLFYNYSAVGPQADGNNNENFEAASNGNTLVKTGGTYIITFDAYAQAISFTLSK